MSYFAYTGQLSRLSSSTIHFIHPFSLLLSPPPPPPYIFLKIFSILHIIFPPQYIFLYPVLSPSSPSLSASFYLLPLIFIHFTSSSSSLLLLLITVSLLYPHCIPTVSILYSHCIPTVSSLYPHCIPTVSLLREVSEEEVLVGQWWYHSIFSTCHYFPVFWLVIVLVLPVFWYIIFRNVSKLVYTSQLFLAHEVIFQSSDW